ncbi:competence protein CoiA [Variovorax sp. LT1P1]|uniref:competence protein CoiA n=1 Tax=Variovorax sp. LT1P1 TaxID=3443730 RepID=UPI003F4996E7
MLTATRQHDQRKVLARDSERMEAPFTCPACAREMVLRKGQIRIHHFAHAAATVCRLGAGETQEHLEVKQAIFDGLRDQPTVQGLELEKWLGDSIADVYAVISGVRVAIEVQRSVLGIDQIVHRTSNYHRMGIAVMWVALPSADLTFDRYSPSAWERWCHAAYFGRVYYWHGGQTIRPVHFGPVALHVPEQSWRQYGQEHSAGGYDKRSKRWVKPQPGIPMLLSHHFRGQLRERWNGGKLQIPRCTLFVDKQPVWWL